jgi:MbtH protein
MDDDDTRGPTYAVVVNDEEQYSLWLDDRELPAGWRREGTTGSKAECLAHIEQIWVDMRPASLRRWIEEQQAAADGS